MRVVGLRGRKWLHSQLRLTTSNKSCRHFLPSCAFLDCEQCDQLNSHTKQQGSTHVSMKICPFLSNVGSSIARTLQLPINFIFTTQIQCKVSNAWTLPFPQPEIILESPKELMTKKPATTAQDAANARVEDVVKQKRAVRPFPACSFEEALEFARAVFDYGSGKPVRRLSLFDHIQKSPESGPSRQLITNSSKYDLIKGSFKAETLELTQEGIKAIDDEIASRERAKARIQLAILGIEAFQKLYDRFKGNKLPARAALIDAAREFEIMPDLAEEAVDTFVVNLRFVGLLQTLSGAERIVTIDHFLETLPSSGFKEKTSNSVNTMAKTSTALITAESATFETTCFYVTPIGEDGSEQRRHSDLFLGSIVEPALEQLGLTVVRADAIDKPGTITRQIIEYLLRSRLVIADLSFQNPNVFYELAIRHAARLPVVQIIRNCDRIPFDVNQVRTVRIDTSDIYTLVPKIETYRAEIASHVRRALEDPDSVDNPITTFYPDFKVTLGT